MYIMHRVVVDLKTCICELKSEILALFHHVGSYVEVCSPISNASWLCRYPLWWILTTIFIWIIFLASCCHSIFIRTLSSQCLLSTLLNWFKLVYGLFGQSNMHCTVHLISAQTSQKGCKCTEGKEQLRLGYLSRGNDICWGAPLKDSF